MQDNYIVHVRLCVRTCVRNRIIKFVLTEVWTLLCIVLCEYTVYYADVHYIAYCLVLSIFVTRLCRPPKYIIYIICVCIMYEYILLPKN